MGKKLILKKNSAVKTTSTFYKQSNLKFEIQKAEKMNYSKVSISPLITCRLVPLMLVRTELSKQRSFKTIQDITLSLSLVRQPDSANRQYHISDRHIVNRQH